LFNFDEMQRAGAYESQVMTAC